jgi:hypothetical protein
VKGRIAVVVVATMVCGAAALLAWRAFNPEGGGTASAPSSVADPWAGMPQRWTELPPPPEVKQGTAFAWTGGELLYWGGVRPGDDSYAPTRDGYAFDPTTGEWRSIPDAPIPGKYTKTVWTGSEAIFWGVEVDGREGGGVAFDPATERWRVIQSSPHQPAWGGVLVWTGTELIQWGGGRPGDPENTQGAAYDPGSDTWRMIAEAPIGLNLASGVWTGREMIVFGSLLDNRNVADTDHAVGAAYNPAIDTWRTISPSDLSPQASAAVWMGDRMIAYDYVLGAEEYLPDADTWRDLPKLPLDAGECYPDAVVTDSRLFAWYCGQAALFDLSSQTWQPVGGGMIEATIEANGATYKLWRFASLAPAGGVIVFAAEGITVTKSGEPCYGCSGSPTSFWLYRPPAVVS